MGRQAVDGSFDAFQQHVKSLQIDWEESGVQAETLRGETLVLPWKGPFQVNGAAQSLAVESHYDGPHCTAPWPASQMDVQYGDYALRLLLA
jgi:hypothetical protein